MFIMLPPLLYGQNKLVEESIIYSSDISSYKKKIEKTIFFDTETNLPVFELILDTARSSKMYTSYYFRKRLREVSTEISYIGGNESLRKYQDRKAYSFISFTVLGILIIFFPAAG